MASKDDPGYPYGEFDAVEWANEFKRIYPDSPEHDIMVGWFANAIMTGYDRAKNESPVVAGWMEYVVPTVTWSVDKQELPAKVERG